MTHPPTPDDARAALVAADLSAARLHRRARWASTKLAVFGVGMGLVTLSVGLVESKPLGAAVFVAWGVLALGMSHWERHRAAHLRGTARRTSPMWTLSFAAYGVAIAAGTQSPGDPAYWIPAAVLVPLPLLAGALRERRA